MSFDEDDFLDKLDGFEEDAEGDDDAYGSAGYDYDDEDYMSLDDVEEDDDYYEMEDE